MSPPDFTNYRDPKREDSNSSDDGYSFLPKKYRLKGGGVNVDNSPILSSHDQAAIQKPAPTVNTNSSPVSTQAKAQPDFVVPEKYRLRGQAVPSSVTVPGVPARAKKKFDSQAVLSEDWGEKLVFSEQGDEKMGGGGGFSGDGSRGSESFGTMQTIKTSEKDKQARDTMSREADRHEAGVNSGKAVYGTSQLLLPFRAGSSSGDVGVTVKNLDDAKGMSIVQRETLHHTPEKTLTQLSANTDIVKVGLSKPRLNPAAKPFTPFRKAAPATPSPGIQSVASIPAFKKVDSMALGSATGQYTVPPQDSENVEEHGNDASHVRGEEVLKTPRKSSPAFRKRLDTDVPSPSISGRHVDEVPIPVACNDTEGDWAQVLEDHGYNDEEWEIVDLAPLIDFLSSASKDTAPSTSTPSAETGTIRYAAIKRNCLPDFATRSSKIAKLDLAHGPLRTTSHGNLILTETGDWLLLDSSAIAQDAATQATTSNKKLVEGDPTNKTAPPLSSIPEMKNGATALDAPRLRKPLSRIIQNYITGSNRLPEAVEAKIAEDAGNGVAMTGEKAFNIIRDDIKTRYGIDVLPVCNTSPVTSEDQRHDGSKGKQMSSEELARAREWNGVIESDVWDELMKNPPKSTKGGQETPTKKDGSPSEKKSEELPSAGG